MAISIPDITNIWTSMLQLAKTKIHQVHFQILIFSKLKSIETASMDLHLSLLNHDFPHFTSQVKKEAVFLGQTCQARATLNKLTLVCSDLAANMNTSLHNNILPIKFLLYASLKAHIFKTGRSCIQKNMGFHRYTQACNVPVVTAFI